jgi:hypothetical protein
MDGYFGDHRQSNNERAFIRTDDQSEKALEVLLLRVCHVCMRIPDEVSSSICSRQCYIGYMVKFGPNFDWVRGDFQVSVEPRSDRM